MCLLVFSLHDIPFCVFLSLVSKTSLYVSSCRSSQRHPLMCLLVFSLHDIPLCVFLSFVSKTSSYNLLSFVSKTSLFMCNKGRISGSRRSMRGCTLIYFRLKRQSQTFHHYPNTKRYKRTLIYFDTDTQYAHFRGNSLYQATKRHLNIK